MMYAMSGLMKIFMFDKISRDVRSFAAMPGQTWLCLGILELLCVAGLIMAAALRWHPTLTVAAAALLALESLIFIWVHVQCKEMTSIILSAVLGLLTLFIAYGRYTLRPIA